MLFNDSEVDFANLPSPKLVLRLNCCERLIEDSVSHLDAGTYAEKYLIFL